MGCRPMKDSERTRSTLGGILEGSEGGEVGCESSKFHATFLSCSDVFWAEDLEDRGSDRLVVSSL